MTNYEKAIENISGELEWFKKHRPDCDIIPLIEKDLRSRKQKKYYRYRQAKLREEAIEWQFTFSEGAVMYWSDIAEWGDYFAKYGKRFGLLREFRENAII